MTPDRYHIRQTPYPADMISDRQHTGLDDYVIDHGASTCRSCNTMMLMSSSVIS